MTMLTERAARCADELRGLSEAGAIGRFQNVHLAGAVSFPFHIAVRLALADLDHLNDLVRCDIQVESSQPGSRRPPLSTTPSGTVLVLEDDVGIRDLLSLVLADDGHAVRPCGSAEEIVDLAASTPDVLAVVDFWGTSHAPLATAHRLRPYRAHRTCDGAALGL
jgi:hypothetical protein